MGCTLVLGRWMRDCLGCAARGHSVSARKDPARPARLPCTSLVFSSDVSWPVGVFALLSRSALAALSISWRHAQGNASSASFYRPGGTIRPRLSTGTTQKASLLAKTGRPRQEAWISPKSSSAKGSCSMKHPAIACLHLIKNMAYQWPISSASITSSGCRSETSTQRGPRGHRSLS